MLIPESIASRSHAFHQRVSSTSPGCGNRQSGSDSAARAGSLCGPFFRHQSWVRLPVLVVLEGSRDLVGIVGGVFVVGNSGFVQAAARDWQARGPFGYPSLVEHAARCAEYRNIPVGNRVADSSLKARWDGDGSRGIMPVPSTSRVCARQPRVLIMG